LALVVKKRVKLNFRSGWESVTASGPQKSE